MLLVSHRSNRQVWYPVIKSRFSIFTASLVVIFTGLVVVLQLLDYKNTRFGGASIGWYAGNPSAFSHSHAVWSAGFVRGLGSQHLYTPNTQDTSSRFVASAI